MIITDKHIEASNSTDMSNLKKASEKYGHVKWACVTNRGLIVVCENGILYSNIPTNLEVALKSINFRPDRIVFTDSGTYFELTQIIFFKNFTIISFYHIFANCTINNKIRD